MNSRKRNFDPEHLAEALKRLEEKMEGYLKELEECDKADDERLAGTNGVEKLREKIDKLEKKRQEYTQAQDLMKKTGQKEVSLTDPESRLMKNNGRIEVCYNAETAIDSKNKLAVDYDVTNSASDRNQLSPMAKSAKETLEVEKIDATADRGFHDSVDIQECVDNGITPYVPEPVSVGRGEVKKAGIPTPAFYADKFVYDKATDSYLCPAGQRLELYYWSNNEKGRFIPFATNVVEGDVRRLVRMIPREYRRRWGIETSFRKVKEVFPMTTSPSPAIRLAYFMVAMILYNLWQLVNMMLATRSERKRRRTDGYRVTMPFMVTVICAHLNGRL